MEKVTFVTFRVTNEKGKKLKATVHVNHMKQFYSLLDKPYTDTSPTVIEQGVQYLNDELELSSDKADKTEEIKSHTDTNNMTQNENVTQEISCHRTKIIQPKNTDNIKLRTIAAEHQNLELGPPKDLHIYQEEKISITNQSYPNNNLLNAHQWINSQQIDQYFGRLSLLFVAILLMMTSSTFVERIDLGTWYDCTQTVPLGIYSYPTLRNYSYDMFSSLTMVKSYKAQVYQYSPNVSKFPKYSWLYTIVKLKCDCENIFAEKQKSKKEITQHITIQQCHQLIHSFTATSTDGTLLVRLLPVSETFWKSYIDLSYSCTFGLATTNTQHLVTIHKPMEQIIGDSPTIEQHLTRTQCFSLINYSTRHGMSIPVEYKNKILIWADTNHHKIEVHSLGI